MDPQSPPKRMTRARAAAKTDTTAPKTTRVMTAAAKAKAAPVSTRPTISTKRKTRADDNEHDELSETTIQAPRPRGRPKKAGTDQSAEPSASSALGRATRARAAARQAAADAPKPEPKAEPVKVTRGRPRKAPLPSSTESVEPPKRTTTTTRSRAAPVTATRPATRKHVTFQEPEKENVDPATGGKDDKASVTTGLRGRPVRKPPVPRATRATNTKAAAGPEKAKMPLSPKKVTQMPHAPDMSEDELTADSPVRPMQKSPAKPPSASLGSLKKPDSVQTEVRESDLEPSEATAEVPEVTLTSPAKRVPSSPFKDSMKSPAKRADGAVLFKSAPSLQSGNGDTQATPFKSSLLSSPAKRPQSALKGLTLPSTNRTASGEARSPMKMSLMQSPAKRASVPIKTLPTPVRPEPVIEAHNEYQSDLGTPTRAPMTAHRPAKSSSEKLLLDEQEEAMDDLADELMLSDTMTLQFPGRLSAVLPRHADPALKDNTTVLYERLQTEQEPTPAEPTSAIDVSLNFNSHDQVDDDGDSAMTDEPNSPAREAEPFSPVLPSAQSASEQPAAGFGLREKDMNPYNDFDSESDDEASPTRQRQGFTVPATPAPAGSSRRSLAGPRASSVGFTPLAAQLSNWAAGSPSKRAQIPVVEPVEADVSLAKSSYFEDEMTVRSEAGLQTETEPVDADDLMNEVGDPEFDDILVTSEDMELAAEADEMSLLEPEQVDDVAHGRNFDDSVSDASQEYGDENEMPVDPAMLGASIPPVTPRRMLQREFHTVSKVPLKSADESTPRPRKKKRAASISRLPVSRPTHGLTRSATVISYSPAKSDSAKSDIRREEEAAQSTAPATPMRSESWSAATTPARTPRRDLNTTLLSGAVVYVDVHTSEGADASALFVELLTQMGARCVENWSWNPHAEPGTEASRIGITHVVFKDGSRETTEKIRETAGVVQCVGVSWVLDCERENQWLDEAPYYIATSVAPRSGGRRRQTMEPKALADMQSLLMTSPTKGDRNVRTAPNTPMNRRDSSAWIKTPSEQLEEDEDDWQALTPVPFTPAPDALARYAANVTPETPTAAFDYESPSAALGMQTCPPKASEFSDLGEGLLERKKDEGVMMRLMAARRKSLQFAPKVGSPLARAWR